MTKLGKFLIVSVWACVLFISCKNKDSHHSNFDAPRYHDLHLELAHLDTLKVPEALSNLEKKYGDFIPFFLTEVANMDTAGQYSDTILREFFTHKDLRALHDTVAKVFSNTGKLQEQLNQVFFKIHQIDSTLILPKDVFFYTSGLNHVAFTYKDTILGIGLDRFFGSDFWPYESRGYPSYVTRSLVIDNIPVEAAKNIYLNKYAITPEDKNLLELMVHEGKMLCFLEAIFPNKKMNELIGYTPEQWKWCEDNEVYIYKFFLDQKLLYDKSTMKTMRYIAPTPSSMGMPAESPGRTGCFIGYQILKAYLKQSGKTISEVLYENIPAQSILQTSKYKPKR